MSVATCPSCKKSISVPQAENAWASCPHCSSEYQVKAVANQLPSTRKVVETLDAVAIKKTVDAQPLRSASDETRIPAHVEASPKPTNDNLNDGPLLPGRGAARRRKRGQLGRNLVAITLGLVAAQAILWWLPGPLSRDPLSLAKRVPNKVAFVVPDRLRPSTALQTAPSENPEKKGRTKLVATSTGNPTEMLNDIIDGSSTEFEVPDTSLDLTPTEQLVTLTEFLVAPVADEPLPVESTNAKIVSDTTVESTPAEQPQVVTPYAALATLETPTETVPTTDATAPVNTQAITSTDEFAFVPPTTIPPASVADEAVETTESIASLSRSIEPVVDADEDACTTEQQLSQPADTAFATSGTESPEEVPVGQEASDVSAPQSNLQNNLVAESKSLQSENSIVRDDIDAEIAPDTELAEGIDDAKDLASLATNDAQEPKTEETVRQGFAASAISAHLLTAETAYTDLVASQTNSTNLRQQQRALYLALGKLSEAATFADVADPELVHVFPEVVALLDSISHNRATIQLLGIGAAGWMHYSERTTSGIVVAGEVLDIFPRGDFFESRIQPLDRPEVYAIISKSNPETAQHGFSVGQEVVIMGSIINTPATDIAGYLGDDSPAVWMSYRSLIGE